MKVLLDTVAFLWWVTNDNALSDRVLKAISNPDNEVFFSAASAWEIVIKIKLGRMKLKQAPDAFIRRQLQQNNISRLPIEISHALYLHKLPEIHRDPFDRILIAQSQLEQMRLATNDLEIMKYDVDILW
jgi:PIN domain nuclease of toxin-antitoxin system